MFENEFKCQYCEKQFTAAAKTRLFCSMRCSAIYNNTGRVTRQVKNCLDCSKVLSRNNKIYCDNQCQQNAQRKSKIAKGFDKCSARFMKAYLIQEHGAKCMVCKWNEVNQTTGNVPIEINHIDGNSENNELSNLELLCPNCHSLTSNYKALNKGHGRYVRRQRYKDGLSY